MNTNKGFTLFELLTVITIVGILSALTIPSLLGMYNPLKSTAAMIDGKMNAMMMMARADRTRTYCITQTASTTNPEKFVGISFDDSPTQNKKQEPSLDFELPEGIYWNNSSSKIIQKTKYPNSTSFNEEYSFNTGKNCTQYDRDRPIFRHISDDGSDADKSLTAFNGTIGGKQGFGFDYIIISKKEGDTSVDAGIAASSSGQSRISYRRTLANGSYVPLPNY
jgi:prepilin-type N-terminal cleavage/methylation domain-containing protein